MTRLLIPLLDRRTAVPAVNGVRPPVGEHLAVTGPSLGAWARAVSTSADAALVLDPRGAVVAASAAAAELVGRSIADLLGHELSRAGGFVDFHAEPHPVEGGGGSLVPIQALRHDTQARGLMRVRTPDGRLVTCDAVASALHDGSRRVIGVLTVLRRVSH